MQIKLIPERGYDGQVDISAYITDEIQDDSGWDCMDQTICKLGSIENGGLEKLIELSNCINYFLLDSILESNRDSIVCSRSYGVIYMIRQLLNKWFDSSELLIGSEDTSTQALNELFPSLLTALLDRDLKYDSPLSDIQRRIYLPKDISLNASTIRDIIRSIHIFSENPSEANSDSHLNRQNENPLKRMLKEKLVAWATSDCGPWNDFSGDEGITRIVSLAASLCNSIEEQTTISWQAINEHLSELQAIRVESGVKTLLMTTRPTSMQLSIFYRLEFEPPPLVIIEQNEKPIVTKEEVESDMFESFNYHHDPVFESNALSVSNNN